MTPTEKHREAGRKLWEICLNDGTPEAGELIAIALADFEREGMKRAAAKATEHARELRKVYANDCARSLEALRDELLSEAGEA